MNDGPINYTGEHFDIAVLDASDMQRAKGAKKYLGFIPELCIVCGACVDHCPWHCLFMIDAAVVEGEVDALIVDDAIKQDSPRVVFWVDDVECTRCNVCVERCPTDAITMDTLVKAKAGAGKRQLGTT